MDFIFIPVIVAMIIITIVSFYSYPQVEYKDYTDILRKIERLCSYNYGFSDNELKKTLDGIDNAGNFERLLDKMVKDGMLEENLDYISDSMYNWYNKGPKYSQIYDYILN